MRVLVVFDRTTSMQRMAGRLSYDLPKHRSNGGRIEGHELERKRHQLVHRRRHSAQIEIFEYRCVARKEHVVYGEVFAFAWINRW